MNKDQAIEMSPAGSRLAHARWNPGYRNSEEKRKEAARALAYRRWGKATPAERAAFGQKLLRAREEHRHARIETRLLVQRLLSALAL